MNEWLSIHTKSKVVVPEVRWNNAFHMYNAACLVHCRPPSCFTYSCHSCVNCPDIMYFTLPLFFLGPFLSFLFSRAFLYDHKNRKCQWLSFDRNTPGAQSQQDFNYQLYQKKGALNCSNFSFNQLILKSPDISI